MIFRLVTHLQSYLHLHSKVFTLLAAALLHCNRNKEHLQKQPFKWCSEKLVFLKSGKNPWKFVWRSSVLFNLWSPAGNFTTKWTPLHVFFKGFAYILMNLLWFSTFFGTTFYHYGFTENILLAISNHFRLQKFCPNSIYVLKMFEAHMLENFLWKSSAVVKLQVYTNSFLKNHQLVHRNLC